LIPSSVSANISSGENDYNWYPLSIEPNPICNFTGSSLLNLPKNNYLLAKKFIGSSPTLG
jgi:hypothetical protein